MIKTELWVIWTISPLLYTTITVRTFKIHTSCEFLLFVCIPFLGFILLFDGFSGCRGWGGLRWEWGWWYTGVRRINFAVFFFFFSSALFLFSLSFFTFLYEGHRPYWKTVIQHHQIWICRKLPSCLPLLTRLIRNTNQIMLRLHLISSTFTSFDVIVKCKYSATFVNEHHKI